MCGVEANSQPQHRTPPAAAARTHLLRVAVVGCGTGGPAAALLLKAAGHVVEVLERVPEPSPVGAGLLLQPTGQAVLARLGLLDEVEARSARVERLHGETADGRVVIDMAYGDLAAGVHGLGVHRDVLFGALWNALHRAGIPVRLGTEVTGVEGGRVLTADGVRLGPYDLVIAADGARSRPPPTRMSSCAACTRGGSCSWAMPGMP